MSSTKNHLTFQEALLKAQNLCSTEEKCKSDVRKKLFDWGVASDATEKIIAQLIAENFIDERRFARSFTRDKMRLNKWGKLKISFELNQRKLPKNVIIEAVSLIDENEYFELLKKETKKKLRSLNDKDPWVKKGKLHRYASSKGFESEMIFKVLDDVMGNIGENEDSFSEN
jgi:regulatory protein